MTTAQIQQTILDETGIKTSVKKLTGSMKHHIRFSVMFQNGEYPKIDFDWRTKFVKQFKISGLCGNYTDSYGFDILNINIEPSESLKFKTERKPLPIEQQKVRQWGSANSQMRLDKATARNAKRLKTGTTARYY